MALFAAAAGLVSGQRAGGQPTSTPQVLPPGDRWRRAQDAWEIGDYPSALKGFVAIVESPASADYLDRIALLTGELYTTIEITSDGRNPRISPDGQHVSFEASPTSAAITKIVRLNGGAAQPVADVPGLSAAFDRSGSRIIYLRPAKTPEWTAAANALDAATATQARQAAQAVVNAIAGRGDLVVRDLANGAERVLPTGAVLKSAPVFAADGASAVFVGADAADLTRSDLYVVDADGRVTKLTDQPGFKTNVAIDPKGAALLYSVTNPPTFASPAGPGGRGGGGTRGGAGRGAGGGRAGATTEAESADAPAAATTASGANPCGAGGGRGAAASPSFGVVDLKAKTARVVSGSAPAMSADGSTVAWLVRNGATCTLNVSPALGGAPTAIRAAASRLDAPALSADGSRVAYQAILPTGIDWELFVSKRDGSAQRVTREIQHDLVPRFLNDDTLLGLKGEPRHRRSYVYDLRGSEPSATRLFANNTLRTISPEYLWLASAGGSRILIQAERDGDTISPDRGVYVVDRTKKVPVADLIARLRRQLADETALRARTAAALLPLAPLIRKTIAGISPSRAYEYGKAMFDFDSKHVSQPGNARAIDYLNRTYASFGYTPELQWFEARAQGQTQGYRTANVVSTLKGTTSPDLIYVVSSHFDSVAAGPGADDDTSGTEALLETARVLARTPLPATVMFASFTGEESGLLGSREFVRLAAERKWRVAGALNNDMIGWAGESARMDNTIRHSNAGIRDLQHGAAILFSKLVTYDAKYYKGTDANSFFDGWGDIVGGIGSYPILGNPNYHQATDLIETINFQQVAETAKVTTATIIALASSPSRLKDLRAARTASGTEVTWAPSPETDVKGYLVEYPRAGASTPVRLRVTTPRATLPPLPEGATIRVKAGNARGLEGWDWAAVALR